MAINRLSTREVQLAKDGDHSDGGGLLLRVHGSSSSWVLRFTSPAGKRREMGLGPAARASAAQAGDSLIGARAMAHAARELLRRGTDPIDERQGRRRAERQAKDAQKAAKARESLTLARWARDYHERAIEPRMTEKHCADWIASLENHVRKEIWHAPIATIKAPQLLAALSMVRSVEKPGLRVSETLQRVRQRLDAVFDDAIFHGHCGNNPAAAIRRKMRETLPPKQAGEFAALPYREVPTFMARLRREPGIAPRCLEFALLTAARTGEVLGAKWAEFDLDAAVWAIPGDRMKVGEPHIVYLSPPAMAVLAALRRLGNEFVFPSPMLEGRPLSNMAMLNVLGRMRLRDRTTVHGLCRASFSTWANETAAARADVIEACLAHREADKVKAAYNRAQFFEERRDLMNAWATFLDQTSSVVYLERAA